MSQSLYGSINNLTIPEIVMHYERKLQTLYQLLEKGEEAMRTSADILKLKEKRRKRKMISSKLTAPNIAALDPTKKKERSDKILMF